MADETADFFELGYFRLLDALIWFFRRFHSDAFHYVEELREAGVIIDEDARYLIYHLDRIMRR